MEGSERDVLMKTKAKNVRPGEWLHILGAARFVLQSSKSGDNQEGIRLNPRS